MRATLTGSRKNLIYASKLFYQKLINGKISIPLLRSTCFSSVGEPAIFFFYPVLMSNVNNRSYATEGYFLENKTTNELTNLVKWCHLSFFFNNVFRQISFIIIRIVINIKILTSGRISSWSWYIFKNCILVFCLRSSGYFRV